MIPHSGAGAAGAGWRRLLWRRWVAATTAGELVGFAVPAAAMPLVAKVLQGMSATTQALVTLGAAALAGAVEGASLGLAQTLVLRCCISDLAWWEWVRNTSLAAALAYIVGMMPSALMDLLRLSPVAFALSWVLVGPMLLVSIGFAQWLVLRRHVRKAGQWVLANAIAWLAGLIVPFVGIALVPDGSPVAAYVAAGIASGVLMGTVVGMVTGIALLRLLEQHLQKPGLQG